jgi:EAL domain-containing protein (putative c-di-GMP-specific phosphodiesterase class I)
MYRQGLPTPPRTGVQADVAASVLPRPRVLIIDDDASMRRFVEKALGSPALVIDSAADGTDALALLGENSYDTILTDIAMPGMNGVEFLRTVREMDPDVPVVLITGNPALETAIEAIEHGAFRYLLKPVSVADLRSVTERAIRLHALTRLRRRAVENEAGTTNEQIDRDELAKGFDRALGSLHMVYQPIVSSREARVFGYEALVRSNERTLSTPPELLAAAEQLGRVVELGRAVRARVAGDASASPADAVIFVNVHPAELEDETLYGAHTPFSRVARRIVLEVTERASLDRVRDVDNRIARLRAIGFRLAVDDLGAAYSGLATLARIEPDIVKLDMVLARGLASQSANRAVIRSMVQLCLELGMAFVCEGVETEAQRDAMIELGCDLFQGYLYSRPERGFQTIDESAWT